jgi:hypothetical protein
MISHLPIIHCQHDVHISNQIKVISQQHGKNIGHPIQKMSQGRNRNESWGRMTPASPLVHRIPHLSPYQRQSLLETAICFSPLLTAYTRHAHAHTHTHTGNIHALTQCLHC